MQKIRVLVSDSSEAGATRDDAGWRAVRDALAASAGMPAEIVVNVATGDPPPTVRGAFDMAGAEERGLYPPPAGWLVTALQGLLAIYEALPPGAPARKLGKQIGAAWVGGSNRLNGQPHDICAEIRALLAAAG